jgi:hypothetical protein
MKVVSYWILNNDDNHVYRKQLNVICTEEMHLAKLIHFIQTILLQQNNTVSQ